MRKNIDKMEDTKQNYEKYWKEFLKKKRQPKWCERNRLRMIVEYFWRENLKYCDEDDCRRCDTLLKFVTCDKRPYGDKDIPASIVFNLGWGYQENDYMTKDARGEALSIHNELIKKLEEEKEEERKEES